MNRLSYSSLFFALIITLTFISCTRQEDEDYGNVTYYNGTSTATWMHRYTDSAGHHVDFWDTTYADAVSTMIDPGNSKINFETSSQTHRCAAPKSYYTFTQASSNTYLYTYDSNSHHQFAIVQDSLTATFTRTQYNNQDTVQLALTFKGK